MNTYIYVAPASLERVDTKYIRFGCCSMPTTPPQWSVRPERAALSYESLRAILPFEGDHAACTSYETSEAPTDEDAVDVRAGILGLILNRGPWSAR